MGQGAELLEALDALEVRFRPRGEVEQRLSLEAVEADVTPDGALDRGARVGNRCAREVQRPALEIADDLDDVRVVEIVRRPRERQGRDRDVRVGREELRQQPEVCGRECGLVALDVEHDRCRFGADRLRDPVGSAPACSGHHRPRARSGGRARDSLVVRGDEHLIEAAGLARSLHDVRDHRFARDGHEGFAGEAGGGVARRNHGKDAVLVHPVPAL